MPLLRLQNAKLGGEIHNVSRNRARTQVLPLQARKLRVYGSRWGDAEQGEELEWQRVRAPLVSIQYAVSSTTVLRYVKYKHTNNNIACTHGTGAVVPLITRHMCVYIYIYIYTYIYICIIYIYIYSHTTKERKLFHLRRGPAEEPMWVPPHQKVGGRSEDPRLKACLVGSHRRGPQTKGMFSGEPQREAWEATELQERSVALRLPLCKCLTTARHLTKPVPP